MPTGSNMPNNVSGTISSQAAGGSVSPMARPTIRKTAT